MRNHIAFIDSGIDHADELLNGMHEGVETVALNGSEPALDQMARFLGERSAVAGIHIFAHGSPGAIAFSSGTVSVESIGEARGSLRNIEKALSQSAAVDLWSCGTGQGSEGDRFLSALSNGFARPVAAASGKIGAASLGGSWVLDRQVGAASVVSPVTPAAMAAYAGVLANNNATTAVDTITQTTGADTLTVTSTSQIQATDLFDGSSGIDAIVISGAAGVSVDLTAATNRFRNYEGLTFNNTSGTSTATLNATQFGTGFIAVALAVTGTASTQAIVINNASTFSAAAFTFTTWTSGTDTLTINGTTGADTLTGSSFIDTLSGGAGNDTLLGGAGADILNGGTGADTFVISALSNLAAGETINGGLEAATQDTLRFDAAAAYNLSAFTTITIANIDQISLNQNAAGFSLTLGDSQVSTADADGDGTLGDIQISAAVALANGVTISASALTGSNRITVVGTNLGGGDTITGGAGADTISSGAGTDIVNGGAGADTMAGGAGDDTYIVDNAGDVVTENAGEGTDTVQSSVSFTLGANVDNLTLTGASAINATGNAAVNTLNGNSAANTLDGGAGADTLVGGAGNDIYAVDNTGDVVTENAAEGTDTVQSSITFTLGVNLENLTLTGTGVINGTGNADANTLTGNSAANTLSGGAGADTMAGGAGNDIYVVDIAGDVVTELASEGTDTVQSSVTYTASANVENVTLTGAAVANAYGNTLANVLTGNSAANTLNGGAGADTLTGGLGNDNYVVDNAGDVIVENAGEGTDSVQSAISFALAANFENLQLVGAASVNATGNSAVNVLTGNSGANVLDGDAGADTMTGGAGDDTYIVDDSGDVIVENANEGTDTVQASASFTLAANFENLTLDGTSMIDGTGNSADNVITGNIAVNVLTGGDGNDTLDGGSDADTMIGGLGDDTYATDNAGDVIVENAGEGTDTVLANDSFVLGDNIENLTLVGVLSINATGNAGANVITGNGADNVIDGDAGADTMVGGAGDDTYVVDDAGDVIVENASEGSDTVQASFSIVLTANIENVTLTGGAAIDATGSEDDNILTGNGASNTLIGGAGNDTLDGGAGLDTMIGGVGDDTYVVSNVDELVTENAGEGTDTVRSSDTYTIADNIENLTLTGATAIDGTGNAADNVITGSDGNNILAGLDGNDTLDGGAGVDKMSGGLGDDTYVIESPGDVVTEALDEGTDLVLSSVNHLLGSNVENLTLTGSGSINGSGNALDNLIVGNAGANTINGGLGADIMSGGAGNDTYVIDELGDVVNELENQGTDAVHVGFTYVLGADLENLTLTGMAAIDGTGNGAANTINGNSAGNVLAGLAGNDTLNGLLGADTMTGGLDNDTYVVDNAGDVTTENAGEGTDIVQSSISHTLAANIENLTLTGAAAINGNGNDLSNTILGNSGVNILAGLDGNDTLDGAVGADRMSGGLGDDTYIVDNAGDLVIESASSGTDTVQSSATHTLSADVENLVLTGASGIHGTGNALANSITGNSGANILNGGAGADILSGGGGNDTFVVDNAGDVVNELLSQGTDLVQAGLTFVLGANLENLTLTGTSAIDGTGNSAANVITGNGANNTLTGHEGNDTLTGLGGSDTTAGGLGNDIHVIDNAGDVTVENAGEGSDTVQSSITHTLMANLENLTLTGTLAINGTGNELSNAMIGNSAINVLSSLDGNDTLDGRAGADILSGGAGNDTYVVDNVGDLVSENTGEGIDTIQAAVAYALVANVENLQLTGTALINGTGNAEANSIVGNGAANTLNGGDGNDTLNGGSGNDTLIGGNGNDFLNGAAGTDAMSGGAADDTYVVDAAGDTVTEAANEGTDLVQSSQTFTLTVNVENLTLTGNGAIDGTGNGLDNVINGNGGANKLYGLGGNDTIVGGAGADTMTGGAGDDNYTVDNVGDVITELASEGADSVQSSVTYTLSVNVENLTLIGTGVTNGTGNASDNLITGNGAANILTGLDGNDTLNGGQGGDKMTGGLGNDTYVVDSSLDVIVENVSEGADTVQSRMAYVLGTNLENLTLTGTLTINGTGNSAANILTGNIAANTLNGAAGADTLIGGAGNDTYVVDNAGDVITELDSEGTDSVQASLSYALAANVENLTLTGTAGFSATGNDLDNIINGNDGANIILAGAGIDTVSGGIGDDLITGGAGADVMYGGAGNDTFIFTAVTDSGVLADTDLIVDFNVGDRFDVSAIDANLVTTGDQAFVLDTDSSFSIGEIGIEYNAGAAIVRINQDADSDAEMVFVVQNVSALVGTDFIL